MIFKSKLKAIFVIVLLIVTFVAVGSGAAGIKVNNTGSADVLFLDPGHGGIDGGAVSLTGVPEKDINLAIAKRLRRMAEDNGWQVVMTRETDTALGENENHSIRAGKVQDLKLRTELLRESSPDVAVSIHLNSFKQDSSVCGVQVFYPGSGGGRELLESSRRFAEVLQGNIENSTGSARKRTPMIREGVFIFREITCPVTIVECGFLSNPEEAAKLQDPEYQEKIARGIMDGITEFTGKKTKNKAIIDSYK